MAEAPTPVRHVLACGLTLLLEPDAGAQTVAAGYFVDTGSREERAAEGGVSHFLEHLLFKGSARLGAAELNARLDDLGGHVNAFTGEDATVYHAAALPARLPELLDTLTELMRPALRPEDIEAERGVILEEIAMYAGAPEMRVAEALRADYWGGHPLGAPILGTAQSVARLDRAALRRHHRARYGAPRVTLAVTGAFEPGAVLAWAQAELRGWPTCAPRPALPAPVPAHPGQLRLIPDARLGRVQVALAAPGVGARDPLREAAGVLAELLGGEGALHWALLDPGLADSADFGHVEHPDAGVFEGGFSCDPERLPEVLATYRRVLRGAAELVTDAAVRRVARKQAVDTLLRADTPQERLFSLGLEYLVSGRLSTVAQAVDRHAAVTPAQVLEVLRRCPLDALTAVALGPLDRGPLDARSSRDLL